VVAAALAALSFAYWRGTRPVALAAGADGPGSEGSEGAGASAWAGSAGSPPPGGSPPGAGSTGPVPAGAAAGGVALAGAAMAAGRSEASDTAPGPSPTSAEADPIALLLAEIESPGTPPSPAPVGPVAPVAPVDLGPVEPGPAAAPLPSPTVADPVQSSGVRIVGPVEGPERPGGPAVEAPAEPMGERIEAPQGFVTREDLGLGGTAGDATPG